MSEEISRDEIRDEIWDAMMNRQDIGTSLTDLADAALERLESLDLIDTRAHDGDGWRDIESAPKDGTLLILYDPCHINKVFEGYYDTDDGWRRTGWRGVKPTQWRPRPAPPQSTLEQEKRG